MPTNGRWDLIRRLKIKQEYNRIHIDKKLNLKNMKEYDKQQLNIVYMTSDNVGHLITKTITTL